MYEPVQVRPLFPAVVLAVVAMARPAFAVNPRAEAAALDALSKAEGDFLGMNYASGAARLDKALRACAPVNCSAGTQAALLRDIGTMEFRAGDKGFATRAFTEALKLQPNIDLNPSYDAPELRALWNEVKGGGAAPSGGGAPVGAPAAGGAPTAGGGPASPFAQPKGDFIHTPAAEQRYDTPLPIYIEGGPNGVAHVIVRYKSSEDSEDAEWQHMDLSRVGAGWGGQLPCNAVISGTVRYYIQGYNKDMDPIATNGDAKDPYQVTIRDELTGQPPHLPNRAPPRMCHPPKKVAAAPVRESRESRETEKESEDTGETSKEDCPPGMPGCGKEKEKTDEDEEAKEEEGGEEGKGEGEGKKKRKKQTPKFWLGVALHIDFMQLPSGTDVCRLYPQGAPMQGLPANDKHFYCTDPNGVDFPTRVSPQQNDQLTPTNSGQSNGGLSPGNVRLMASLDYTATSNILVGGRVGYVLLTYPGAAAVKDNYAWGQKFYLELRITGFIGKNPLKQGTLAPMIFGGGGVSAHDAHTSGTSRLCAAMINGMPPNGCNMMMLAAPRDVPVDEWVTNGPGFVALGGGLRYGASRNLGLTGAVRIDLSFGNNGLIPTVGPEIGLQYGF